MKAKLNLSGEGIKNFFLNSGEKIVLVITAAILLAFLYSAITAKPLDEANSPERIREKSAALESFIRTPSGAPDGVDTKPLEVKQQLVISTTPVSLGPYEHRNSWDPPLFPELTKRADPKIFAVEEPQIAGLVAIVPCQLPLDAGQIGGAPAMPPATIVERRPQPGRVDDHAAPAQPAAGGATAAALANQPVRIDMNAVLPGSRVTPADPQKRTMVIVRALVPMEKQIQEYKRRFLSSIPAVPEKTPYFQTPSGPFEMPLHLFFRAERAEVQGSGDANLNNLKWMPVPTTVSGTDRTAAINEIAKWAEQVPDIVQREYLFDDVPVPGSNPETAFFLSWRLPPMYLRNWGMEAAHPSPKIKLVGQEVDAQVAPQGNAPQEADNNNPFGQPAEGGAANPVAAPPQAGMAQPRAMVPQRLRSDHDDHGDPRRGFAGGRGGFGQPLQNNWGAGQNVIQAADVPYKLLRFIDFTAEPGKTYRYRLQLGVYNPNYGLKAECLDEKARKSETSKKVVVFSDWSEPTAPVTVPRDFRLLANSAVGARGAEPQAKINLWAVFKGPISESAALAMNIAPKDKEVWLEGMTDINVPLGGIASVRDAEFKNIVDISAGEVRPTVKGSVDTENSMLLDIRNDDPLGASRSIGPTEMLFIDGSGRLTIVTSAVDRFVQADYVARTKVEAAPGMGAPDQHAVPAAPKGRGSQRLPPSGAG